VADPEELECPTCETDDHLRGEPHDGTIRITCDGCGRSWDRDLVPSCPTCGRTDVVAVPRAVWEKARGTQLSITSIRPESLCRSCDPELLREWWDSGVPLPPDENPAAGLK
jgi:hypothetical protein